MIFQFPNVGVILKDKPEWFPFNISVSKGKKTGNTKKILVTTKIDNKEHDSRMKIGVVKSSSSGDKKSSSSSSSEEREKITLKGSVEK